MRKTTVYLPEDLKSSLERMADSEKRSEAEIIREAIREKVGRRSRPRPRIPLFEQPFGPPDLSERVDELLEGFGERSSVRHTT